MATYIRILSCFFLLSNLVSCDTASTETSAVDSSSSNAARFDASSIGFFYFELNPTGGSNTYYFSHVVTLTYSDNADLGRQQDSCMQKLRKKAGNPQGYNQKSSTEQSNFSDANAERKDNIKSLQQTGNTVTEENI